MSHVDIEWRALGEVEYGARSMFKRGRQRQPQIRKHYFLPLYHDGENVFWEDVRSESDDVDFLMGTVMWNDAEMPKKAKKIGKLPVFIVSATDEQDDDPILEMFHREFLQFMTVPRGEDILEANSHQNELDEPRRFTFAGDKLDELNSRVRTIFLDDTLYATPLYIQGLDYVVHMWDTDLWKLKLILLAFDFLQMKNLTALNFLFALTPHAGRFMTSENATPIFDAIKSQARLLATPSGIIALCMDIVAFFTRTENTKLVSIIKTKIKEFTKEMPGIDSLMLSMSSDIITVYRSSEI